MDALTQLLIEKGIISKELFHAKLKKVQAQYKVGKFCLQIPSDKSPKG